MFDRVQYICSKEDVQLDPGAFTLLAQVAGGDLRKAVTTLQSAVRLGGSKVSRQSILDVSGQVPPAVIQQLLESCQSTNYQQVQQQVTDIIAEGYPAQQVLLQLQAALTPGVVVAVGADVAQQLSDIQRAAICELVAEADKDLIDGADEFLQLLHVAGSAQQQFNS
eukprot:GHRR01019863.1.p1 GENE.GHRR01019863.1~~GHRR01019863.1.p1  ORF type:complete len:166 (+),score=67.57 GHRR01019863.1:1358-1855(+)